MQPTLFLVEVLNESPSSFLHLRQSALKPVPVGCSCVLLLLYHLIVIISAILGMPHIVGYKLFQGYLPIINEHVFGDPSYLGHEPFHVLYEDVVSCDEYLFLLGLGAPCNLWYLILLVRVLVVIVVKVLCANLMAIRGLATICVLLTLPIVLELTLC